MSEDETQYNCDDCSADCQEIVGSLCFKANHATIAAQAKEIERLEKALKHYGSHRAICPIQTDYYNVRSECNCGFEKALKGEQGP